LLVLIFIWRLVLLSRVCPCGDGGLLVVQLLLSSGGSWSPGWCTSHISLAWIHMDPMLFAVRVCPLGCDQDSLLKAMSVKKRREVFRNGIVKAAFLST
jgi:hypothetical protein